MASKVPMRGVRVADDLFQKASYVAKINGRSFNQQCIYLLKRMVANYEAKHGEIPLAAHGPEPAETPDTH